MTRGRAAAAAGAVGGAALVAIIVGATACGGAPAKPVATASPAPAPAAGFLARATGEWEYDAEAINGPGQPPVVLHGVEHGRMVGGWAVLETDGQTSSGPFTAILTLGPQPDGKTYVATWISSLDATLIRYDGALDDNAHLLTLDSLGADPRDPAKQIRYRDTIQLVGDDRKELASMMELDGAWVTFVRSHYRRKAAQPADVPGIRYK
jgi:hypothetical protein